MCNNLEFGLFFSHHYHHILMKNIRRFSAIMVFLAVLLFNGLVQGQSVTMGPIPGTSFCSGDPIAVSFTATGFFGHKNAFTLQLSDPSGSFANGFQNIGSLIDTLPGTFTITTIIPTTITSSLHYRFRILAAIPYIPSAENGSDIGIGTRPTQLNFRTSLRAGSTGTPLTFTVLSSSDILEDSVFWDFGSGANPATVGNIIHDNIFTQSVTYSTPGDKIVTLHVVAPGGCFTTLTNNLHIYDCSIPKIPHDAIVINSNTTIVDANKTYWVNPGFTVHFNAEHETIFAEPGSTISGAASCILYMKHGSVLASSFNYNNVIYGDGASVVKNSNDFTLDCPTLDFDYSTAPPNSAHPVDGVPKSTLPSIIVSPNPTSGSITIHGLSSNEVNVSVMNLLGESLMEFKNIHTPDLKLDLSKFVPGTYYVRCASANSVITKMVVRE